MWKLKQAVWLFHHAALDANALLFTDEIPNLAQIYHLGFYEEREFALYVSSISNELEIPVSFPLPEMLDAHKRYGGMGTRLVVKVSAE
ncbi:hypothetical protein JHK87_052764 [Glycine soja]|nr:hypothetical protein JHK87_052764 [Glycine soja]